MVNPLLQPSNCFFQPGDKVAWEFTPPLAPWGLVGEMSGRFVELQQDTALVAVQGTDGEVYRKIDADRLFIRIR